MEFIEGSAASLEKNLGVVPLTFGAELPGLKEDQFKQALERITKKLECEEVAARSALLLV